MSEIEVEVFKLAYNGIRYSGYARTHEKLTSSIYIYNIITKLYKYLRYYPHYQLYQILRYLLYGLLQPIYTPLYLFHIIMINFILTLSKAFIDKNYIISVIDKFSKTLTFIAGEIR